MMELVFWSSLRFFCVAIPLVIALIAARRALCSEGFSALIYMVFSGYAAVAGVTILPWALKLDALSPPALLLAVSAVIFWGALNRLIRRPLRDYRGQRKSREILGLPTFREIARR